MIDFSLDPVVAEVVEVAAPAAVEAPVEEVSGLLQTCVEPADR